LIRSFKRIVTLHNTIAAAVINYSIFSRYKYFPAVYTIMARRHLSFYLSTLTS